MLYKPVIEIRKLELLEPVVFWFYFPVKTCPYFKPRMEVFDKEITKTTKWQIGMQSCKCNTEMIRSMLLRKNIYPAAKNENEAHNYYTFHGFGFISYLVRWNDLAFIDSVYFSLISISLSLYKTEE